jgi:hypothetical protein
VSHTYDFSVAGGDLGVAVLCCAVLCCAVLCCAVLCCAVLCCVVLCWSFTPAPPSPGLHLSPGLVYLQLPVYTSGVREVPTT